MTSSNSQVFRSNHITSTLTEGVSTMNACQLFTRLTICFLICVLLASASLLSAASLSWEGDTGTGLLWTEGIVGTDTNWTDGVGVPPADQVNPGIGDDLTFLGGVGPVYGGPLDLGGNTYEISGITVGKSGDVPASSYGADLTLSSNGNIKLGSGGITSYQSVAAEDITFDSNIELTSTPAATVIAKSTTAANYLYLDGVISGGTALNPTPLTLANAGGSYSQAIRIRGSNTFTGDVTISGAAHFFESDSFGNAANKVSLLNSNYVSNLTSGSSATAYDIEFTGSGTNLLYRPAGTDWTINGDVTGGIASTNLRLLSNHPTRSIIFNGDVQDFAKTVLLWTRTNVILAKANGGGEAWENVDHVRFTGASVGDGTATFKLRGDFTFEKDFVLEDQGDSAIYYSQVGQANDGGTSYDAIFNGDISVLEDDAKVLQLSADDGGSATFNGTMSIIAGVGENYGLDKVGLGTVIINDNVFRTGGTTDPIGPSVVQAGTLLINSPAANDGFNAELLTVNLGATLGGTGLINGNVVSNGTIAPGASIGTLTVDGDVDIFDTLSVETDALSSDLLDVSGTLTLDGASILEIFGTLDVSKTYTLAQAGTLSGTFSAVYFNGGLVLPGELIGDTHNLGYLDNAVVLVGVPEPSSLLLLGMGACVLLRRGRRHGKRRVA